MYLQKNKYFYRVRRNHETRGFYVRHLKQYLCYPEREYYTAFTKGPVRFIYDGLWRG